MTQVLFGQSYYLRFDPKLWTAMQPYPPLGTLYVAGVLRERGHEVALFDATLASGEGEWATALERHRPRFAVLYEDNFDYLSKMCLLRMRQAAFAMTRIAKRHGCTVIVGGSDATDHAEKYLAQGADYVLIGEGEVTLAELLDALTGRLDTGPAEIPGLAHLDRGRVHHTPPRAVIADLDSLPFPARDLVDIPRYQEIWRRRHGYYSVNMVTTRGCPYHCNWCAKPIWGQRYHARSPENVVAEMVALKRTIQPDHIWFADDTMGLEEGWLPRFVRLVEEAGVRIPFKSLNRPDLLLRPGTIEALRRAGCEMVWIGAESGSQRILDAMEKGTHVGQIHEATRRLHGAGIGVGFFLQFGYPGETRDDIELTLQMVRECAPDDIGISVSYPLPGTKFYERVKDQLGARQNWLDSSDLAILYRGTYTTAFYRQLHTVLHKEFRVRRQWAELTRPARRPNRLRGSRLRGIASMVCHAATLPWARYRLNRLAALPHTGLEPLPIELDHEAAARPSPQVEEEQAEHARPVAGR